MNEMDMIPCAAPGCSNTFPSRIGGKRTKKYCSLKCNRRAKYLRDPKKAKDQHREWRKRNREKDRARSRDWYYKNIDFVSARVTAWRKRNPEKFKATQNARTVARCADNYFHLVEVFGVCCQDCKQTYPMSIYHYHHLDPSTKKEILSLHRWPWSKVEVYIQNTVQLCPTCHALRHHQIKGDSEAEKRLQDLVLDLVKGGGA